MSHPFDAAIALRADGANRFHGHTHADYGNMVGPFGGVTAATLLHAACQHPARLGDPLALTVNFAGPVAEGAFEVHASPARTNRSTQHWRIELLQGNEVAATASAVFALRRPTRHDPQIDAPAVPEPAQVPQLDKPPRVRWFGRYEMRFVTGGMPRYQQQPASDDEPLHDTTSTLWVRDEPPRPLDFVALAALCDVFIPRIFVRRQRATPAGTVSITTYFHADAALLAVHGARPVLASARAVNFRDGFFDQSGSVWSHDRQLLASTHQIVYYKE